MKCICINTCTCIFLPGEMGSFTFFTCSKLLHVYVPHESLPLQDTIPLIHRNDLIGVHHIAGRGWHELRFQFFGFSNSVGHLHTQVLSKFSNSRGNIQSRKLAHIQSCSCTRESLAHHKYIHVHVYTREKRSCDRDDVTARKFEMLFFRPLLSPYQKHTSAM